MTAGPRPLSPFRGLLLLLLAFTGVHLYRIEADPPARIGIVALDSGTFVDEGYKSYDARNQVLFDSVRWSSADEYGGGWTRGSPINTTLTRVTFERFGVEIAPVRILSLAFGVGTLLLFWILLQRRFGEGPALIGTTILLLHPLIQLFSRLALLEIKLLFFCLLAVVLVPKPGGERGRMALGWGGVLLALASAYFTKETALAFIGSFSAGVVGWAVFARSSNPLTLRLLTTGVAGAAILFAVVLAVGCPEPDACSFLSGRAIDSPLTALGDFALADFIYLNPAILLLALLGSAYLLRGLLIGEQGKNPQDLILLFWFLLPTLFFNALAYQPERYFLLPLPAMVWLALYSLVHLREIVAWLLARGRSPWPTLVLTVTLFLAALHFTPPLLADLPIGGDRGVLPRSLLALPFGALLALIALVSALALRFLPGAPIRWARSALRPAILALAVLGTALGAGPLLVWAIDPPYQLLAESARIEELGSEAVLVGDWAPQLGMLTEARTIYSNWNVGTGEYRNVENLAEIGATHLVIAEGINEAYLDRLDELFPGARIPEPLLELDYAGRRVLVYEFRP